MAKRRSPVLTITASLLSLAAYFFAPNTPPAHAHVPPVPEAGPHTYPSALCWDGTDHTSPLAGGPFPDQAPQIVNVTAIQGTAASFNKRFASGAEWLTWRPFWKNLTTGQAGAIRDQFGRFVFLPPFQVTETEPLTIFNSNLVDFPQIAYKTHIASPFPPGLYQVGATYGWWDAASQRWILDSVWMPLSFNTGYTQLFPDKNGPALIGQDNVCNLDPRRNRFSLTLPPLFTSVAASVSRLSQSTGSASMPVRSASLPQPANDSEPCFRKNATIVGSSEADVLIGTSRRDVIVGGGGDDEIFGLGASDVICGGQGDDALLGGRGADRLAGDNGDDVILGEYADDLILAGEGSDIVEGGPGDDTASGGGQALDIIAFLFSPAGVELDFAAGVASGGEGLDHFDGFDTVVGSDWNDVLTGTTGEQWFVPLGGDDRIDGGPDADLLAYVVTQQGVTVDLAAGLATGEGTDTLAGLELVAGSPFGDRITGSGEYNYILGLDGDDFLDGVAGDDTADGGNGTDECTNAATITQCENHPGDVFPSPPPVETPPAPPSG